ncbi:MAG TPA: hypothetical protein VIU38_01400 [Anaerolineales bacterium]
MQLRTRSTALIIFGLALTTVCAIALFTAQPAQAQCGSQASSCKNCHETQAQDPVNADGTGWHQSHAFGDFCYICHGGNNQATEKDTAHVGMVAPMSDVQAACAQCHPNDLQARSDVYTAALGIPNAVIGAPAGSPPPSATQAPGSASAPAESAPAAAPAMALNDPNLVDYVQRYNELVLHQGATNWGNVFLAIILLVLLGAGLYLVNRREGWISVSISEKKSSRKPGRKK